MKKSTKFLDPTIPAENLPLGWTAVVNKKTAIVDYFKEYKHPNGKKMTVKLFVISEKQPYWHSYKLRTAALEGAMYTYNGSIANSGPIFDPRVAMFLLDEWCISGKLYS